MSDAEFPLPEAKKARLSVAPSPPVAEPESIVDDLYDLKDETGVAPETAQDGLNPANIPLPQSSEGTVRALPGLNDEASDIPSLNPQPVINGGLGEQIPAVTSNVVGGDIQTPKAVIAEEVNGVSAHEVTTCDTKVVPTDCQTEVLGAETGKSEVAATPQSREDDSPREPVTGSVKAEDSEKKVPDQAVPKPEVSSTDQPAAQDEAEFQTDSSPYQSSSDADSSDSSDSSEDDSDGDYPMLDPAEQARRLMEDDGGSDDEGARKSGASTSVRTLNERAEDPIPVPQVDITPEMKIEELGHVETILGDTALIRAKTTGEYQVLDAGSLLCREDRSKVGVVSETLGRVQQPLYCLRFVSADALAEAGVSTAMTVYYVVDHSNYVFTAALQGVKGSDASNLHDEEVAAHEVEFSDDEAEAAYRRQKKSQKQSQHQGNGARTTNSSNRGRGSAGRGRGGHHLQGRHPHASSPLASNSATGSVAMDSDEPYQRLARPSNLHQMVQNGAVEFPQEGTPRGSGSSNRPGSGFGSSGSPHTGFNGTYSSPSQNHPSTAPFPAQNPPFQAATPGSHTPSVSGFSPGMPYAGYSFHQHHAGYQPIPPYAAAMGAQPNPYAAPSPMAVHPRGGSAPRAGFNLGQTSPGTPMYNSGPMTPPLPPGAFVNPAFFRPGSWSSQNGQGHPPNR